MPECLMTPRSTAPFPLFMMYLTRRPSSRPVASSSLRFLGISSRRTADLGSAAQLGEGEGELAVVVVVPDSSSVGGLSLTKSDLVKRRGVVAGPAPVAPPGRGRGRGWLFSKAGSCLGLVEVAGGGGGDLVASMERVTRRGGVSGGMKKSASSSSLCNCCCGGSVSPGRVASKASTGGAPSPSPSPSLSLAGGSGGVGAGSRGRGRLEGRLLLGVLAVAGERRGTEVDVGDRGAVVEERVRPREGARAAWEAMAKANSRLSPAHTPGRSTNSDSMGDAPAGDAPAANASRGQRSCRCSPSSCRAC